MKFKKIGLQKVVFFLTSTILFGCAHKEVKDSAVADYTPPSVEEQANKSVLEEESIKTPTSAPQKAESRDYVVINFPEGSDALAQRAAEEIKQLVEREKPYGKIDRVEVAAWSDHNAPGEKLLFSQEDQSLAQQRVDKISNYLTSKYSIPNLRVFNLVEVNNDDFSKRSEIKSRAFYSKKDISLPATNDFALFKEKGGPSKAIIIVTRNSPNG